MLKLLEAKNKNTEAHLKYPCSYKKKSVYVGSLAPLTRLILSAALRFVMLSTELNSNTTNQYLILDRFTHFGPCARVRLILQIFFFFCGLFSSAIHAFDGNNQEPVPSFFSEVII